VKDDPDDIARKGYEPISEGYVPDDEQDSLPQPPPGESGEKDESDDNE
jgi:hypothetical protein